MREATFEAASLLARRLEQLRRRVVGLRALRGVAAGLAAGSLGASLLAIGARLGGWPRAVDWALPLLAASAAAGLVLYLRRPVSFRSVARLADQRLDLSDRLASAAEWISDGRSVFGVGYQGPRGGPWHPTPMVAALLSDAAAAAQDLRPGSVFPWRPGRELALLALAGLLLTGALCLPLHPILPSPDRTDRAAMAAAAREYDHAATTLESGPAGRSGHEAVLQGLARELRRLARDQQRGTVTRREALLKAAQLRDALRAAERQLTGTSGGVEEWKRGRSGSSMLPLLPSSTLPFPSPDPTLRRAVERRDFHAAARQLERTGDQLAAAAAAGSGKVAASLRNEARGLAAMAAALNETPVAAADGALGASAERLAEAAARLEQALAEPTRQNTAAGPAALAAARRSALDEAARAAAGAGAQFRAAERRVTAAAALREAGERLAAGRAALAGAAPASPGGTAGGGAGLPAGAAAAGGGEGVGSSGVTANGSGAQRLPPAGARVERVPGRGAPGRAPAARPYGSVPDASPAAAPAYVASPGFRRSSEAALRRERIPSGYRQQVRDYFAAIGGG